MSNLLYLRCVCIYKILPLCEGWPRKQEKGPAKSEGSGKLQVCFGSHVLRLLLACTQLFVCWQENLYLGQNGTKEYSSMEDDKREEEQKGSQTLPAVLALHGVWVEHQKPIHCPSKCCRGEKEERASQPLQAQIYKPECEKLESMLEQISKDPRNNYPLVEQIAGFIMESVVYSPRPTFPSSCLPDYEPSSTCLDPAAEELAKSFMEGKSTTIQDKGLRTKLMEWIHNSNTALANSPLDAFWLVVVGWEEEQEGQQD